MAQTHNECEQYVFAALGWVGRSRTCEPLYIFESPLDEKQGTLFMIETPEGEERGVFHSTKLAGKAMKDMRIHYRHIRFREVAREHFSGRAGPQLILRDEQPSVSVVWPPVL